MKKSKFLVLLSVAFLFSLFLVACGDDNGGADEPDDTNGYEENDYDDENGYDDEDENGDEDETGDEGEDENDDDGEVAADGGGVPPHITALINTDMPSSDDMVDGGTLNVALVQPSPFAGILHPIWSLGVEDSQVQTFFFGDILSIDRDFLLEIGDDARGAAVPEISDDGLVITFTIRDGVYWHDGEPVTARDWEFAFEVLAHPDSTSVRFGQQEETSIVGAVDFNEGNADSIEGIEVLEDNVLQVTFEEVVSIRSLAFVSPLPYHIFGDIPIDEMEDSEYVRTADAIGFGPFILDVIVPGESVTYVRNDDYWQGAPVLDGVELRVVSPELIGEEMAAGNIDIGTSFREADHPYFVDLDNVTFLKNPAFVFNYIGFRLGEFDLDEGESVLDPDATMANEDLRRAMWMAVDNNALAEAAYSALRWDATSLIPPTFDMFHDETLGRPPHDVDAANALLDEAGFEIGDDGYRTDPDGNPLEIQFFSAAPGDDQAAETMNQYYLSQWRMLNLNVVDNFEYEFNAFHDLFDPDVDDERVDVFIGAWSYGMNPSPYGIFGRTAAFNYSRYVSDRQDELLERIDSEQAALDPVYRAEAFYEWQEYMSENMSLIPTLYRFAFVPVNNRVVNYGINADFNAFDGWHLLGFTDEDPH